VVNAMTVERRQAMQQLLDDYCDLLDQSITIAEIEDANRDDLRKRGSYDRRRK
jgi:hypothetical protein